MGLSTAPSPPQVETRIPWPPAQVHLTLGICAAILLVFCLAGERPGTLLLLGEQLGIAVLLIVPGLVPAALLHERRDVARRDASLMIGWTILLIVLLKQSILIATAWAFPLRDNLWRRWDESLGIRVPDVMAWAARHPLLEHALSHSYGLLMPMIVCAVLLPIIFARPVAVQRFIVANALGFVLALPLIFLVPAIGPWVAWHFTPSPVQHDWEMGFRAVRVGATAKGASLVASVCLPSFHVFWAITSAQALWVFRWFRIPVAVLTVLIVFSTVTTGWHYGVDALAGLMLAAICAAAANVLARQAPACRAS